MAHPEHSTMQPTRRAFMADIGAAVGLMAVATPLGPVRAEDDTGTSDWSVADHARVRLIDAGPSPRDAAQRLAGVQIELDPAYLTYWRSPGEAGLPPTVSFAGSNGLKAATLLYPAPGRYSEGGTEAIGYKDGVIFPLMITPKDADKPVDLKMALDFAICERLCLPAKATASLTLRGNGQMPEADLVRDALAHVPAPAQVGGSGPLSIMAIEGVAGDPTLTVRARTEGHEVPMLFAEAPDPWFVQAGEGLWSSDGTLRYTVKVAAKPTDRAPLPLRLTLVGLEAAVEVPVTLDPAPEKP